MDYSEKSSLKKLLKNFKNKQKKLALGMMLIYTIVVCFLRNAMM